MKNVTRMNVTRTYYQGALKCMHMNKKFFFHCKLQDLQYDIKLTIPPGNYTLHIEGDSNIRDIIIPEVYRYCMKTSCPCTKKNALDFMYSQIEEIEGLLDIVDKYDYKRLMRLSNMTARYIENILDPN